MKIGVAMRHAARVREHSRRGDIEEIEIVCQFGGERLFEPTSASTGGRRLGPPDSARECLIFYCVRSTLPLKERDMKAMNRVAGIDVHKYMLAVVAAPQGGDEASWERRKFGTTVAELRHLAAWLRERGVQDVVMESTAAIGARVVGPGAAFPSASGAGAVQPCALRAQDRLRGHDTTHPQMVGRGTAIEFRARSNPTAMAADLPGLGQLAEERTRLHNQIEALLEEGQIKLATLVSDLLGLSGWRILQALAEGRKTAAEMAALADARVRATPEQLRPRWRGIWMRCAARLLRQSLARLELMEAQERVLRQELSAQQQQCQSAIERLCAVPGIQVLAAQKILAAFGARATAFPTAGHLASWVGVCPGREESAGISASQHCPKGHRPLRSLLAQLAWAAVKPRAATFRSFPPMGPQTGRQESRLGGRPQADRNHLGILHEQDTYVECGALALDEASRQRRTPTGPRPPQTGVRGHPHTEPQSA